MILDSLTGLIINLGLLGWALFIIEKIFHRKTKQLLADILDKI